MEDFKLMVQIFAAGVALAFIVSVPDWPWFNRNPLEWLPKEATQNQEEDEPSTAEASNGRTSQDSGASAARGKTRKRR
eukprot:scaffold1809_cov386-Prasinococcus_capsulatus_cf.AAC.37